MTFEKYYERETKKIEKNINKVPYIVGYTPTINDIIFAHLEEKKKIGSNGLDNNVWKFNKKKTKESLPFLIYLNESIKASITDPDDEEKIKISNYLYQYIEELFYEIEEVNHAKN